MYVGFESIAIYSKLFATVFIPIKFFPLTWLLKLFSKASSISFLSEVELSSVVRWELEMALEAIFGNNSKPSISCNISTFFKTIKNGKKTNFKVSVSWFKHFIDVGCQNSRLLRFSSFGQVLMSWFSHITLTFDLNCIEYSCKSAFSLQFFCRFHPNQDLRTFFSLFLTQIL